MIKKLPAKRSAGSSNDKMGQPAQRGGKMITLEDLERLMAETGAGFELCSMALKARDGDYDLARETVYKIMNENRGEGQEIEESYIDAGYAENRNQEGNESEGLSFDQFWKTCKEVLSKVNATSIVVRKEGRVLLNLSVTVGAIGLILAPLASLFALGAAFFTQYEVVIVLEDGREINILKMAKDEANNIKRSWEYYVNTHNKSDDEDSKEA